MAVEPKIAIARILADFGGSVQDRHAYIMRVGNFGGFYFDSCNIDCQTAKFSGYTVQNAKICIYLTSCWSTADGNNLIGHFLLF